MMKFKLIVKLLIVILISSCSSDDTHFDSSFITDYSWKLENYILIQPLDLNLDGIASLDMTEEFECIKDETFSFNNIDQLFYLPSKLTSTSNGSEEHYICSDHPYNSIIRLGYFIMINENTIKLTIDDIHSNGSNLILILDYENNKLTQTITRIYPISYDLDTSTYIRETIEIKKVFIREQ